MTILVVALVIDVMKPASLGFTVPGMIAEYGVPKQTVSLVPFFRARKPSASVAIATMADRPLGNATAPRG